MSFASIPQAIAEFRAGRMVVVVDDEDRENEGDLTIAAEAITPEIINFMALHGRGLICLALSGERCDALHLQLMSSNNTSRFGTAFCESVDASEGVTTGISAADRALTIQVAMRPDAKPSDLARPGHMFPLRARDGGVLVRAGQTEAAVDLARLAGFAPGGVICEIINDDGTMARVPQLEQFCQRHGLMMISVADLIRYRLGTERFLRREAEGCLRLSQGEFRMVSYRSTLDDSRHFALVKGDLVGNEPVLVRMHSHCVYGDLFGSLDCGCHGRLQRSLTRIAQQGRGVLVYLHQRGEGLLHTRLEGDRVRLSGHGQASDTTPTRMDSAAPQHENGIGAQILTDLGLHRIRLLTGSPRRVVALEGYSIEIVDQIPLDE